MENQCTVQVKLELGHRAQLRKKVTSEGFTHDWMVFVRGPETGDIQHFVEKVVFRLHDSFPKPKRVCKEPPYKVEESGYAGFLMPIEVYFKNKETRWSYLFTFLALPAVLQLCVMPFLPESPRYLLIERRDEAGAERAYGNIRVSVEDQMVLVDYTIRKFCIQQVGDVSGKKPQRLVTQFHFTSWPDFGVPFTPIGMLKFLKKVKNYNPTYAGAIVVHCSAGVGRTGTFIVIDAMLDMMNTERKVDVFGFVTRIRAQRCQMVQTDMQYVFIFQALLEHYLYGDTELEVTSLESHLAKLYAPAPGAGCSGLEAEFKKLTSIKIQNDKMRTGNLPANMKKNRVLQIIPYEFNRVIIPVKRGEENTDYVNASFVDGYRQKDSYIASQGPLQHTTEDFWRMIWEWRSCSIVMLTELEERGQVCVCVCPFIQEHVLAMSSNVAEK
ncbi:receptor-type tyrosine-protein phosphatase alpha-like [Notothenia coriiceps]|uniref:protein-tyrosine-phosphatase n=1 Tax=Notothenia coriiceps TaxID=8208 RepID=A0A6I9Q3Q5_9TELE|nr:PREDICTED: receptor-type tyrosine-protein phosphatase alpha-like [Notothenia coriiceps]